jgi:hypothetical protein
MPKNTKRNRRHRVSLRAVIVSAIGLFTRSSTRKASASKRGLTPQWTLMPMDMKINSVKTAATRKGAVPTVRKDSLQVMKIPWGYMGLLRDWIMDMAKTATLDNTSKLINICHKLCLIVLFLYGIAWLIKPTEQDAPIPKILHLLELVLAPKAYPMLPMVLPDMEKYSLTPSEEDTLSGMNLPLPGMD